MTELSELVKLTIQDLVSNFLFYDRKEDEELPPGVIEKTLTKKQVVAWFTEELGKVWPAGE